MDNTYKACVSCGRPLNYKTTRWVRRCPCCGRPVSYVGEDTYTGMVESRRNYDRCCEMASLSLNGTKICDIMVATR